MHREAYDSARRLQGVLDTFKIDDDWKQSEARYGDSFFGKNCLLGAEACRGRRTVRRGWP